LITKEQKFAKDNKMKLFVGGDFNCRLKRCDENSSVVGPCASGIRTSENGELLVDMAKSCGLRVENTFFRKQIK